MANSSPPTGNFFSYPSTTIPNDFPSNLPSPSNGNRTPGTNPLLTRANAPTKHCWVCFATDEDDYSAPWVSPCRCRGTTKWVHQECLQRWVDEKQQGSNGGKNKTTTNKCSNHDDFLLVKVACPQCKIEYIIVYPKQGQFERLKSISMKITSNFRTSCSHTRFTRKNFKPFVSIFGGWNSCWISLLDCSDLRCCDDYAGKIIRCRIEFVQIDFFSFLLKILGHKEGLTVMEKADPLFLLIGLPTIPVVLILGRMIRWEESVLKFWRRHSSKLPLIHYLFPSGNEKNETLDLVFH